MGLTERIQEEIEKQKNLEKVKEKKFKFPFGKKVGRSQKKKNYVTVLVINENSNYYFEKYQIEDQTVIHDLIPRLATAGHIMTDKKGNPLMILPSWTVEPFSPLEHYQKSMIDGANTKGYKIILAKMQQQIKAEKKVGNILKWILGIGLAGIIAYAFLSGGG